MLKVMEKLIWIFLIAIIVWRVVAPKDGFTLKGEITNAPQDVKLFLKNEETGQLVDSGQIREGKFTFTGAVPHPSSFSLRYQSEGENHTHLLWLENTKINLKADWSAMDSPRIEGGPEQSLANGLKKAQSFFDTEQKRLVEEQKYDSINALINRLSDSTIAFASEHANSYMGVQNLYRVRNKIGRRLLGGLIEKLDEKILESPYGQSLQLHYQSPPLDSGAAFIDFEAPTLEGDNIRLSEVLEEKPALLIFGGLSCMGKQGRELLRSFHEEYGDQIAILPFVFARNRDEWIDDGRFQLDIPLLSDMKGDHSPVKIKYGVQITPTTYVVNRQGIIVWNSPGYWPAVNEAAKKLLQ